MYMPPKGFADITGGGGDDGDGERRKKRMSGRYLGIF
jgi:hypothetical protein